MLLGRYHDLFNRLYGEDRDLTLRRGLWGYLLSLLSTAGFYIAYAWIVMETVAGRITLGDMTMYLTVFRQGQNTFSGALTSIGGMYEDNLYLSNLYDFLEEEVPTARGKATKGVKPGDGICFENMTFTYPGSLQPALRNISLHLKPGEKLAIVGENGSGKTTLINRREALIFSPSLSSPVGDAPRSVSLLSERLRQRERREGVGEPVRWAALPT